MTGVKHLSVILMTAFFLSVVSMGVGYAESPVPQGLIVKEGYEHGIGAPIGIVQLVQGTVLIIHFGDTHGYMAKKDLPLFKGDTIITRDDGRISLKLNDGSILTLTTATKLVINESVYDADKENRSAFVSMAVGKVRFWVKELAEFKRSEFKVKTNTAVVGVRGSDFIVEAAETFTKVTALENTHIEVVSLMMPCEKADSLKKCKVEPVTLTSFEQAIVQENALPSRATQILPEESDLIKKQFAITPDEKQQAIKKETTVLERDMYLVPKGALVSPETVAEVHKVESSVPDIAQKKDAVRTSRQEEATQQETVALGQQEKTAEIKQEASVKVLTVLPGFPEKPRK